MQDRALQPRVPRVPLHSNLHSVLRSGSCRSPSWTDEEPRQASSVTCLWSHSQEITRTAMLQVCPLLLHVTQPQQRQTLVSGQRVQGPLLCAGFWLCWGTSGHGTDDPQKQEFSRKAPGRAGHCRLTAVKDAGLACAWSVHSRRSRGGQASPAGLTAGSSERSGLC